MSGFGGVWGEMVDVESVLAYLAWEMSSICFDVSPCSTQTESMRPVCVFHKSWNLNTPMILAPCRPLYKLPR